MNTTRRFDRFLLSDKGLFDLLSINTCHSIILNYENKTVCYNLNYFFKYLLYTLHICNVIKFSEQEQTNRLCGYFDCFGCFLR